MQMYDQEECNQSSISRSRRSTTLSPQFIPDQMDKKSIFAKK